VIVLLIRNSFFKKRNARLLSLISLHAMQIFILYEDRCDCSFDTEFFFSRKEMHVFYLSFLYTQCRRAVHF